MVVGIEVKGLRFSHLPASLQDVSFGVPQGQVTGLVGPRDAGEMALLQILAGQLPADSGRINLNGYDLHAQRDQALSQVTLLTFTTDAGGAKARLKRLANASTPILLLDAPTGGLYGQQVSAMEEAIKGLATDAKQTVIIGTDNVAIAQALCDRIILLQHGRIVADLPARHRKSLVLPAYYQIRLGGRLEPQWSAALAGMTVIPVQDETILSGPVADQAALHALLNRIRDLGLPLIAVEQWEPELQRALETAAVAPATNHIPETRLSK